MSTAFTTTGLLMQSPNVWVPDGTTGADVQDALDAATAGGGGIVDLLGASYTCSASLSIEPTLVSIRNGKLNFSAWSPAAGTPAVKIESLNSPGTQFGHSLHFMESVELVGNANLDAFLFDSNPTGGVDRSSRYTIRNCYPHGFRDVYCFQDNAFLTRVENSTSTCSRYNVRTDTGATNMGENIVFEGCTFGGGTWAVYVRGGWDMSFFACSFDFQATTGGWVDTYQDIDFHSCHFEIMPPSVTPFKCDWNGRLAFFGGTFAFDGAGATNPYLFDLAGSARQVKVYGVRRSNITTVTAISNDLTRVSQDWMV